METGYTVHYAATFAVMGVTATATIIACWIADVLKNKRRAVPKE